MSDIICDPKEEIDHMLKGVMSSAIILHNDDVNTFDHVIECLQKYCNHSAHQAEQCAIIVHHNGKCSVKEGDIAELVPLCEALQENNLSATIE